MYHQYPSEQRTYPNTPGKRFWAAGFRLSDPPSKIVRNMPPTLVETTCGGREDVYETELRKTTKYAGFVAPVGPDDKPLLKKTSTCVDLRFFTDRADAEAAYRDETGDAVAAIETTILGLQNLKAKVLDIAAMQERDTERKEPGHETD